MAFDLRHLARPVGDLTRLLGSNSNTSCWCRCQGCSFPHPLEPSFSAHEIYLFCSFYIFSPLESVFPLESFPLKNCFSLRIFSPTYICLTRFQNRFNPGYVLGNPKKPETRVGRRTGLNKNPSRGSKVVTKIKVMGHSKDDEERKLF